MTLDHIVNTIFHAGVWRAMHGVSPIVALAIAAGAVAVGLYLRNRT